MRILNDAKLESEQSHFLLLLFWRFEEQKTTAPAQFGFFELIQRAHKSVNLDRIQL